MGQSNAKKAQIANTADAHAGIFRVYMKAKERTWNSGIPNWQGLRQYPPSTILPFGGGSLGCPPHILQALPPDVLNPFAMLDAEFLPQLKEVAPNCCQAVTAATFALCGGLCWLVSKKNEINTLVAKYMARVVAECAAFTQQVAGPRGVYVTLNKEPYRIKRGKHYVTILLPFLQFTPAQPVQGVVQQPQVHYQQQSVQQAQYAQPQYAPPQQPQQQQMERDGPPPAYDANGYAPVATAGSEYDNVNQFGGNKYGGDYGSAFS